MLAKKSCNSRNWIICTVRSKLVMLEARQGFGEEVRDVFLAGHMLNAELPLPNAILQPVKAHVDAL